MFVRVWVNGILIHPCFPFILPSLLNLKADPYEGSLVIYLRPSGKVLGIQRILHFGPDSAMVYDIIVVQVTIEYVREVLSRYETLFGLSLFFVGLGIVLISGSRST